MYIIPMTIQPDGWYLLHVTEPGPHVVAWWTIEQWARLPLSQRPPAMEVVSSVGRFMVSCRRISAACDDEAAAGSAHTQGQV